MVIPYIQAGTRQQELKSLQSEVVLARAVADRGSAKLQSHEKGEDGVKSACDHLALRRLALPVPAHAP